MDDVGPMEDGTDGWQLVPSWSSSRDAAEIRERNQIRQWAESKGHWSGHGKHITRTSIMEGDIRRDAVLGQGGAGFVERVTYRSVTMAQKTIFGTRLRRLTMDRVREEANIMEKLAHRHIVTLIGTYTWGRNLALLSYPAAVCDLQTFLRDIEEARAGTCGDLNDTVRRFERLGFKVPLAGRSASTAKHVDFNSAALRGPLSFLQMILGCVTDAVAYVHRKDIRHQDLKPGNILLNPDRVYLTDFGISRDLKHANDSLTASYPGGTSLYQAPEIADGKEHHMSPADIYSLGCIFLNVATVLYGAALSQCEAIMGEWDQGKKEIALRNWLTELGVQALRMGMADDDPSTCMPKHLINLIEHMLSSRPEDRPTALQVSDRLSELGGLDQIYYGNCCKRDTAHVVRTIGRIIDAHALCPV